jgi:RimJ/RimL family protein N-acetyltransferase
MELHGDDFVLRQPSAGDIDAIVAELGDPDIVRFIPLIPTPYARSDAAWWVDRAARVWADGSACPFVIVDAGTGRLLGAIEVRPQRGDIGYWIAADARGRGLATRALELICDWRTERPLWLMTHPDNRASQRVAEKSGFRRIGLEYHEPHFRDGTPEAVKFELA